MLHGKGPAPCRNRGPSSMGGAESVLDTLKENDVRLVTCVPDNVLTPLIKGKQPTSTQATARASGIAGSFWIRDEAHFDQLIDRAVADGGPTLLAARIDDQSAVTQTVRDPALIRNRFMKGLGTGRGGALDG